MVGEGRLPDWRLAARLLVGLCVWLALCAQTAVAQRLRGRLLDLDSGEPLRAGLLTLRGADRAPIDMVFSGEDGGWAFELPGPGVYYVEAARMDYEPWVAGPLEVADGDDLDSVFRLRRRPILLDPLEVSVAALRRHLERAGFYERQRSDFGYFMTPEDIERQEAPRLTDLLLRVPGVKLISMGTGSAGARYVTLRGSNLSQGGVCRPRVFVDGILYALGDSHPKRMDEDEATETPEEVMERIDQGLSLDDIGPSWDIAAIEVYRSGTQVPVLFGGTSVETLCGVIVIWTRRGIVGARR
ncbi:MAG TPA: TonB-dependent receptor [Longimicrobiales bacterium]|nr:TonB-dependent receptor [Longimicrobiales bacterium]